MAYIPVMAKAQMFKKAEPDKSAYQAEQDKIHANMLRLKAERLAREAAAPPAPPPEPKVPKARKKTINTGS